MAFPHDGKKFKKGKSGNENGRPHKLPQLDVLLANVLGDEKDGTTAAEAILMALRQKAAKGDVRAAEMLFDRGFGKVAQTMELKGGPLMEATIFVLPNGRKVQI